MEIISRYKLFFLKNSAYWENSLISEQVTTTASQSIVCPTSRENKIGIEMTYNQNHQEVFCYFLALPLLLMMFQLRNNIRLTPPAHVDSCLLFVISRPHPHQATPLVILLLFSLWSDWYTEMHTSFRCSIWQWFCVSERGDKRVISVRFT